MAHKGQTKSWRMESKMTAVLTEARNANLGDLAEMLKDQHARKIDVVAPASAIESKGGLIHVTGTEAILTSDGVTMGDGVYQPTAIFDEGVAAKLQIPLAYVRRMRAERPDLYDANVNGWLHGQVKVTVTQADGFVSRTRAMPTAPVDERSFLLRMFRGEGKGVARALLSDTYKPIDHFDVLTAALQGVRDAGAEVQIESADLTERRMTVRVWSPAVRALAPVLLAGYRNPFRDANVQRALNHGWDLERAQEAAEREGLAYDEGTEPIVFAGFEISNSETGNGAFTITPRLRIKVCKNGLIITEDALRSVHLGGKLDEGVIDWSDTTQQKAIELVTSKTTDAVRTFMNVDYMTKVLTKIEAKAGVVIAEPEKAVQIVSKKLQFDEATTDAILRHFIMGGQMTAGGILNAVTSVSQTIKDADKAHDVESAGLRALELAAAL
jgi:hypothetical protein